jgi:hypothetical protein
MALSSSSSAAAVVVARPLPVLALSLEKLKAAGYTVREMCSGQAGPAPSPCDRFEVTVPVAEDASVSGAPAHGSYGCYRCCCWWWRECVGYGATAPAFLSFSPLSSARSPSLSLCVAYHGGCTS